MVSAIWTPPACAAEQPGVARGEAREQTPPSHIPHSNLLLLGWQCRCRNLHQLLFGHTDLSTCRPVVILPFCKFPLSVVMAAAIAGGQAGAAKLNVSAPGHIKRAVAGLMLTAAFGGFMCSLVIQVPEPDRFRLSVVSMVVMLLSGHRALFL